MDAWQTAIWLATCGAGAILFLKAVADELDRSERNLRGLEQAQRRAFDKRRALQIGGDGAVAIETLNEP